MPTVVESFEHIIQHQSTRELVPFLLTLSQEELVALRQPTQALQKDLLAARLVIDASNDSQIGRHLIAEQQAMVALAGLATFTKKEGLSSGFELPWAAVGYGLDTDSPHYSHYWQVMRHFRPDWLGDFFMSEVAAGLWQAPDYTELRQMEREGLIAYHPPLFAMLLGHYLARYNRNVQRRNQLLLPELEEIILADLLVDPELLGRDIWLLFEHETIVNRDFAYIGQYIGGPETTWLLLLPRVVTAGHLNRFNVLTHCLLALRRNFSRQLLTWFKDLYVKLAVSQAERLALKEELLELLPHTELQVVKFALAQLTELLPEPEFSLTPLLRYADSLFTRSNLKTSLRALLSGLLKRLKQDATHAPAVAHLLGIALSYPDGLVQERAAKGLAGILAAPRPLLSTEETAAAAMAIGKAAELLDGPARTALAAWLGPIAPSTELNAAVPYVPAAQFVPELSAATAIVPVADWHELLFLTGQVLQHNDPAATERWLDGLLRLNGQWPAGFAGQLRPYLAQLFPEIKKASEAQIAAILSERLVVHGHKGLVQAMLLAWATGFKVTRVQSVHTKRPHPTATLLLTIEKQRYLLAESLLRSRQALPLLSTPTHQPHWVAPSALVARLLAYQAAGIPPEPADFAVALARTAHAHPTDAAEALRQLPALASAGLRELLTWFLGPADQPLPPLPPAADQRRPAGRQATVAEALPELWAVAARTKVPASLFPTLPAALGYDYPDVAQPLLSTLAAVPRERIDSYTNRSQPPVIYYYTDLTWDGGATLPAPSPLLLYAPPVGRSQDKSWEVSTVTAPDLSFFVSLLPQHPGPVYEQVLLSNIWSDRLQMAGRAIVRQALQTLLPAGPAYLSGSIRLLASGLVHDAAECRSLAQEVLLSAVAEGRLLPGPLGRTLGLYLATDYVPVMRLVDGLNVLAGTGAVVDDALTQVLEVLVPELPAAPPRNTGKLLEVYANLRIRTARPLPAAVQVRLQEWQKAASLRKAVSAMLG
jgi:hypothetical protein